MLVVPGQLAGIGIERQRRIGIERIVIRHAPARARRQQGADVVGIAGAEIHQIQIRIIAADRPYSGAVALVDWRAIPAVAARLARPRDGVETPQLPAALRIQGDDEVTAAGIDAQADTDDDLAVNEQRATGNMEVGAVEQARARPVFGGHDRAVPAQLTAFHIQCDDMAVGGGGVEFVLVDRQTAHARLAAAVKLVRQRANVLPENRAIGGIDRFYRIGAFDEQHAVVDQGCGLIGTWRQRESPGDAQIAHRILIDLSQGAVAERGIAAAPHQPIAGGRTLQHRIGYRADRAEQGFADADGGVIHGVLVIQARGGSGTRGRNWRRRGRAGHRRVRGGELRSPGCFAVFPQQVGRDVRIRAAIETARTCRRHPLDDRGP